MKPVASTHTRMLALQRLGHTVIPFDTDAYEEKNPNLHRIAFRLVIGPGVNRLNRDLPRIATEEKVDLLFADKVLSLRPGTIRKLQAQSIFTLCYVIDNAFGPRKDPGWRLYKKSITLFDLHVTQRDVSVHDLTQRGARDVIKTQTAYDQAIHFPPPEPYTDAQRNRGVSFLGTPYDDRAGFLSSLHAAGLPVVISGSPNAWQRALSTDLYQQLYREGELAQKEYREAIWRSKINVSFLTKSNQDEVTQKSFEIAACGGFLLAERSEGHSARFVEGEEAVFFSGLKECIAVIQRYLPDEAARNRIAAAGMERARRSGYNYDHQVALLIERVEALKAARAKVPAQ